MPVVTLRINVPETVNPDEVRRKVELEIAREFILRGVEKGEKVDFKKLRGALGKASAKELDEYALEAELGDIR
ncbi:hypothetical protein [Thermococcus sp.]